MAKYDWYTPLSEVFMGRGYFHNNDTIQDRVESIRNLVDITYKSTEITNKTKEYIELGYYVLPSPVWSNVGSKRGSGISCFNTHIEDSVESITEAVAEISMQCKIGGGTSSFWGDVRPAGSPISTGGVSFGTLHFMEWVAKTKETISQGSTRRGEHAVYLPVDHDDISGFLNINGEGSKLQRLPFGITIPEGWLQSMKEGDIEKRNIWAKVLDSRSRTGFPYLFFDDNVNNNTVDVYKDLNLKIKSSNMCTEVLIPSTKDESFVCDLIGMNLVKYDEWKNTDAVRIAVYIADAVLTEFIDKNKNNKFIQRSVKFAENHRAIGVGASGYHSYLQSHMIPFESLEAKFINKEIFFHIEEKAWETSREMWFKYGSSDMMNSYCRRHSVLTCVAPNTSSSFIMGQQSQSIEPYVSNYYIKKASNAKHSVKNPYLEKLLLEKDKNTFEVWESILKNEGSVKHLDFLSDDEKLVFRTFIEISQMEIIIQASQRQKYIDQGQSLNLMIHPNIPTKDVNALILKAHELGIKTLYYQLGQNAAQNFARDILSCESCAG